jgi:hypothetical protein
MIQLWRVLVLAAVAAVVLQMSCKDSGTGATTQDCDAPVGQWQLLGLQNETITAIAIDPHNPSVIYVGSQFDISAGHQGKLFKSTNCGHTWDTLVVGGSYTSIVLDPKNPQIVYAALRPIIKSTDAGQTWREASNGMRIDAETRVSEIIIDPVNTNVLYAGTGGFMGGSLYKSTDGGMSWRDLGEKNDTLRGGIASLALDPNNPRIVYAGNIGSGVVLKSTDAGETWSVTGLSETGEIIFDLLVHPQDSRVVFAAISFRGISKSEDEGRTWNPYNTGLPPSVSGMKIAIDVRSLEIFCVATKGDDGWIYKRASGVSLWVKIGIENVRRSYYYSDLKLTSDGNIYFGTKGLFMLRK